MPTAAWLAARAGTTMPAVFALYDGRRALQYVGLARHAVRAVRAAAERAGEERAAYVRAMVFANRAMATRAALQEQADRWLAEAGTTPPGNGVERGLWEVSRGFLWGKGGGRRRGRGRAGPAPDPSGGTLSPPTPPAALTPRPSLNHPPRARRRTA